MANRYSLAQRIALALVLGVSLAVVAPHTPYAQEAGEGPPAAAEAPAASDEAVGGGAMETAGEAGAGGKIAAGATAESDRLMDEEALAGIDGEDEVLEGPSRWQPVLEIIDAGGPIIIILAILSVISLAIIIVKIVQFTRQHPGDHRFVEKVSHMLEDGDADQALDFVENHKGVVARVMESAIRGRRMDVKESQVREEVERVARMKLDGLESGLQFLSLIATISPLLGLLGTVLGMIEAFQQLENAGDRVDPAILSGGIWEALLTTAAGLSVAIPAAAFFTWFQRIVDGAGQHMEDAATRVFTADIYRRPAEVPEGTV